MEFKFGLEMLFCTLFKKNQESSPYIYTSDKYNNFVCVNMYYVMHMTEGSQQLKIRETYTKYVKIEQSDLISKTTKTGISGF
jgi:hypothetical protein